MIVLTFLILYLALHIFYRVRRLHLLQQCISDFGSCRARRMCSYKIKVGGPLQASYQGDGLSREGLYKDLHCEPPRLRVGRW